MATTPTINSLLSIPFNAAVDYTTLADYCDKFAENLMESDDPVVSLALCGRLSACMMLLKLNFKNSIPPYFTNRSANIPSSFETDPDLLCDYCLALLQVLTARSFSEDTERALIGLTCELVWYFAAGVNAPCHRK